MFVSDDMLRGHVVALARGASLGTLDGTLDGTHITKERVDASFGDPRDLRRGRERLDERVKIPQHRFVQRSVDALEAQKRTPRRRRHVAL